VQSNIYLPVDLDNETIEILSEYGFRWCKKDCRWESRRKISPEMNKYILNKVEESLTSSKPQCKDSINGI